MNTINMPGFTADKSVYKTNGYYRLSAGNADGSAREVLPMLGKTCGACRANSDCRKVDNYCGGCNCLALGPGETGPRCDDPVNCFVSPCAVTPGEAVCENGRCILR
jgi:hypothetical protein